MHTACFQEVDDGSPRVTVRTYDMDENGLVHLVTDTVVEMLYIHLFQ